MVFPVSLIVVNLYTREVESKALVAFSPTLFSRWYRYVDDAKVKVKTYEVEARTMKWTAKTSTLARPNDP